MKQCSQDHKAKQMTNQELHLGWECGSVAEHEAPGSKPQYHEKGKKKKKNNKDLNPNSQT
jgi:hypothetical protein